MSDPRSCRVRAVSEYWIFFALIFALLWVGCAVLTAVVAGEKGYSPAWLFVGLLFGPLALLGAAGLPDRESRKLLEALIRFFAKD